MLIGLPGLSPHYQIMLTREGALDTMTVEVELAAEAPKGIIDLNRKSKEVQHHLKSMIGVTCNVTVKLPGEVPRSQGKAVRVKDLRKTAE